MVSYSFNLKQGSLSVQNNINNDIIGLLKKHPHIQKNDYNDILKIIDYWIRGIVNTHDTDIVININKNNIEILIIAPNYKERREISLNKKDLQDFVDSLS